MVVVGVILHLKQTTRTRTRMKMTTTTTTTTTDCRTMNP